MVTNDTGGYTGLLEWSCGTVLWTDVNSDRRWTWFNTGISTGVGRYDLKNEFVCFTTVWYFTGIRVR